MSTNRSGVGGPTTEEGKSVSSRDAAKYGIYSVHARRPCLRASGLCWGPRAPAKEHPFLQKQIPAATNGSRTRGITKENTKIAEQTPSGPYVVPPTSYLAAVSAPWLLAPSSYLLPKLHQPCVDAAVLDVQEAHELLALARRVPSRSA